MNGDWRDRLTAAADFLRGRAELRAGPLAVTAEVTSRCELACPSCLRPRDAFAPMDMARDTFDRLWESGVAPFEQLILYGLGEPLSDPDFFEKAEGARRRGAVVQVSTNATGLDDAATRKLLAAGVHCLIFSLDAVRPETYRRLRPGADFARVVANVRAFLVANERAGRPVFTIAQMVTLPENRAEAADFAWLWRAAGADAVRDKVDEVRAYDPAAMPVRSTPCPVLWCGPFFIRADGAAHPCCHAHASRPLGNIREQSLRELWNHPEMQALRAAHVAGDGARVTPCNHCFLPAPPRLLTAGAFLPRAATMQRLLPIAERYLLRR